MIIEGCYNLANRNLNRSYYACSCCTSFFEYFDSKVMVHNLCAAQRCHQMTHFLTFACYVRKHFGTKPIKLWIENGKWKEKIPSFNQLTDSDKK